MTEEEYFRENYPDFCYGDKPLSPHWDLFQYGVEFGERQSEKRIAELEKENAELKAKLKEHESIGNAQFWENVWSWKTKADQLTKAKELLKKFMKFYERTARECYSKDFQKTLADTEQFINSEVENDR